VSVECFRHRRFREASLRLITLLSSIASDYAADGMKLTVRQLYYQCVARDWIENNEREYQRIIRLLTDAREAGLFDWAAIEDRGREVVMRTCWESPADILSAAASSYHEDRWNTQDTRVVVVLEKAALAGIVEPVCKDLDTPLLAAIGYSSATLFYEVAKEWICSALEAGQDVVVLHLGDHDPSGLDMTRDLRDRLSLYSRAAVDVQRVALNMDQVGVFNPPPNFAKESDKRFEAYRRQYGDQCWELDALPPEELARLTRASIEKHIDGPQWRDSTAAIEEKQASLRKLVGAWEGET
jgi:hypothetical protein